MATFVLVHGAWHGGWCWRLVGDLLTQGGHRVFAPSLTGLADRSHLAGPQVTLDTHIADVVNLIKWEDLEQVVLCGHSYAGMVITGVAEQIPERLAAISYLDAVIPKDGQSLCDIFDGGAILGAPDFPPPPVAMLALEGDEAAWVQSKLTPHPPGTTIQPLKVTGAYERVARKNYVLAAKAEPHPAFARTYEQRSRDSSWSTHRMNSGHDIMIEDPAGLAAILEDLAKDLPG